MTRTLVAAALTAAALAAPAAHAQQPTVPQTDLVYTVGATGKGGATSLDATCVFRPDRWTADYGPTYIDGYASTAGIGHKTSVHCWINSWGSLAGEAWGNGDNVALIQGARGGVVGSSPHIEVCVEAYTSSTLIDAQDSAYNCDLI